MSFLCRYMSLYTASLNSGSNGNCYYIGNGQEAVLIDAGISCRETEIRMARLNLSMKTVKAIFISHEHGDHIKGVNVLSKKYNLPVYFTEQTFRYSRLSIGKSLVKMFRAGEPLTINTLRVTAFAKKHDAKDPHSFTVEGNGVTIGIFTDIGNVCNNLVHHFKRCDAAYLEANYDNEMLANGAYSAPLKQRIRGGMGHLSNEQALDLFKAHKPAHMSHLFLSHLSADNNCPEIVSGMFNAHAGNVQIVIASRHEQTEVFHITSPTSSVTSEYVMPKLRQASLF